MEETKTLKRSVVKHSFNDFISNALIMAAVFVPMFFFAKYYQAGVSIIFIASIAFALHKIKKYKLKTLVLCSFVSLIFLSDFVAGAIVNGSKYMLIISLPFLFANFLFTEITVIKKEGSISVKRGYPFRLYPTIPLYIATIFVVYYFLSFIGIDSSGGVDLSAPISGSVDFSHQTTLTEKLTDLISSPKPSMLGWMLYFAFQVLFSFVMIPNNIKKNMEFKQIYGNLKRHLSEIIDIR